MTSNTSICRLAIGLLLILAMESHPLSACKVPVFRYALERWSSDNYRVVVVVNRLDDEPKVVAGAIAKLRAKATRTSNVELEVIEYAKLDEAEKWQLEYVDDIFRLPILQVFYPTRDDHRELCWSGQFSGEAADRWLDSPMRNKIVGDLSSGLSAVWLVVEGPDSKQNDEIATTLQHALDVAQQQIQIPEGVIKRNEASEVLATTPGASMDDVLRCDLPLKIEYSVLRLQTDAPVENELRHMIESINQNLKAPYVVPIFGRGRMLSPITSDQVSQSNVLQACKYLVGECTCSVKSLNPGMDLLLSANWQEILEIDPVFAAAEVAEPALGKQVRIPSGSKNAAELDQETQKNNSLQKSKTEQESHAADPIWRWIILGTLCASVVLMAFLVRLVIAR